MFIAGGLGGIVSESRTEVAQLQNGGLSRVNADIQEQLDGFVTDLLSLRNDPNLVALLDGTRNVQSASARAAEIMALESLQYVSIRYLRFNDAGDAVLDFGRFNNNGQISDVVTGTADDIYVPVPEAEIVFSAMVRGEITTPILSDFYVRDDGSNTIMIDSYVPVIRDGQVVRIINIEIDATTLRNTINLALGAQFDEQTGRRVLLIENNNNVIADSGAVGTAYIENLDAVGGNIAVSDYYRNVVSVDGILNGTSTPLGDIPNSLSIYSSQLVNYDLLPNLNWTIIVTDEVLSVYASSIRAITLLNVLVIFGGILVILFCRQAIAPVMNGIYEADTMMQTAALNSRTVVPASGSHSDLVNAARRVNNRLNKLNEDLEDVQNRRERDLQVAGRIGRETATLSDLKTLTNRSINLICNELGFYHAQIFLLDSSRTQAVLRYSRGEAGRALLEQGHQLAVGSDTVIGTVTAEGRPVIVNDTSSDSADGVHGFNRFLSETRAEMALPLMIGEQVLGALDIQSRRPFVFQEDDIPIYQLLADQLAVAIYNAQLREDAERRLERSQRQSQQYTRDAWQDTRNKLALSDKYGARLEDAKLSSDIRIRGEVIGSLEANLPDDMNFSEAEQQIIDAVADRVSLTLENVRLFQETQVTLRETSILYELSSQLNAADDLEDVLSAVIETIAADASGGQVWLFDETSFGRDPQWVQITDDIAISARPERVSLRGRRYQIVNYPFLQALTGDAPTIVQDVNDGTFVQDNLRNLFLSISGQALAIVPLSIRGIWRGFLSLTYAEPRTFGTQEQRLLQALITQAGVAVDNRLLYQQQENALVRQEKLYAASRIINTSQSLADLVYAAVATSSDPDLDFWLSLIEGNKDDIGWGDEARIVAKSEGGSISNTDEMHEILIPANSPMRQREPEILVDPGDAIEDVPTSVQWMRSLGYRFMAIFPLFSDNNPIALFYILNEDTYSLSQDDYDVYRALTGQMSTQIQNKNLLQQTEETLSEMRRLYAAARAINGARDLSQIYSTLAQHLTIHFQQRSGILSDDLHLAVTVLLAYPEPSIHAPQLRYEYQWYSDSKRKAPVPTGTIISQEDAPFGSLVMEDE
ncbi:MAG: GAF domain-containing protein, partial [Chloroflexota bacterium]